MEYLTSREDLRRLDDFGFTRDSGGTLRHSYSVHPRLADDIKERGIDEYNAIWNVLGPDAAG
jgi:hypothetical protein